MKQNKTPILDFPITEMDKLYYLLGKDNVYTVYVYPPSEQELKSRLKKDNRDLEGNRYNVALKELTCFKNGDYDDRIDYKIKSDGQPKKLAEKILSAYNSILTNNLY